VKNLLDARLQTVVSYQKPEGGMSIWVKFNKDYPIEQLSIAAAKQGLYLNNGKLFDTPNHCYNALRFGFASLNPTELTKSVEIICSCLLKKTADS
jgi:GntR family transcriptional regulator/MocR family aminotransferase